MTLSCKASTFPATLSSQSQAHLGERQGLQQVAGHVKENCSAAILLPQATLFPPVGMQHAAVAIVQTSVHYRDSPGGQWRYHTWLCYQHVELQDHFRERRACAGVSVPALLHKTQIRRWEVVVWWNLRGMAMQKSACNVRAHG